MEFRSITNVEEINELAGDEKILVNSGGTAKQISAANAKFGGGSVTKYYISTNSGYYYLYKDENLTQKVTAQEAYDAFMSGMLIGVLTITNTEVEPSSTFLSTTAGASSSDAVESIAAMFTAIDYLTSSTDPSTVLAVTLTALEVQFFIDDREVDA